MTSGIQSQYVASLMMFCEILFVSITLISTKVSSLLTLTSSNILLVKIFRVLAGFYKSGR
ncbi:unnamed protein product [Brassica rapa subsp. trilocularis]